MSINYKLKKLEEFKGRVNKFCKKPINDEKLSERLKEYNELQEGNKVLRKDIYSIKEEKKRKEFSKQQRGLIKQFNQVINRKELFESVKKLFNKDKLSNGDYINYVDGFHLIAIHLEINNIGTTKLRKVYHELLSIKESIQPHDDTIIYKIQMVRPKLAYLAARERKISKFVSFIDDIINELCKGSTFSEAKFDRFMDMMEGIVAYRKYVGNDQ